MALLETRSLTIGYAARRGAPLVVAHDLHVHLDTGAFVCLLGPNGTGKSTLMRTLAGMQPTVGGFVLLNEVDVTRMSARERARRISVVLTDRIDAGHLDVRSLVGLGRYPYTDWVGRLSAVDHRKVAWAIDVVGANDLTDRPVNELSDGERQKVMIARALAQDTDIVMLDEPTAFLDLPRRVEIVALLRRLARDTGKAILMSTHDLDLAVRNADYIWLMSESGIETDVPEAHVLSGAFGRVFEREGIHFDRDAGAFTVASENAATIVLHGGGLVETWTTRALERVGFDVRSPSSDGGAEINVVIEGMEDRPTWRFLNSDTDELFYSLDALIQRVSPLRLPATPRD